MKNTDNFIPAVNLKKQYLSLEQEINSVIKKVLNSGIFLLGDETKQLEEQLSEFIGVKFAVTLASGTDALTLSLKALNVRDTDEVIIPANSYPTAFGVALSGAKLVLADVDPLTLNLNLENIKKVVTSKTKVIIPVHLYGNPVDIIPIKKFAEEKKIYLIEDCAQAIGASIGSKMVGAFGDIATFSFYPTKNLNAFGDAGAVVTQSKKIAQKIKALRVYGETSRYNSQFLGHNSRIDEIQAAILKTKLPYLKRWNQKRHTIASFYRQKLAGFPIEFLQEQKNSQSVYHQFIIKTKKRKALSVYLRQKGIITLIHYPIPLNKVKTFLALKSARSQFPISEKVSKQILSLPIYPELTKDELNTIVEEISNFFNQKS